jgi:diguanylate cyclase (GGDEF)-like protein/PAS domain S-box-containing protein
VLDSGHDQRFDSVARVARLVADAPIAVITIVDEDRVWFKARVGIAADEIEREASFCAASLSTSEAFVVEDASADERFAGSALVHGPTAIRFYAGVPISAPGGERIGNLAVLDSRVRGLAPEQVAALTDLASMVDELIARGALAAELEVLHERDHLRSAALGSLDQGVLLIRPGTGLLLGNESATRILGFTDKEILQLWNAQAWETFDENGVPLPIADRPIVRAMNTREPELDRYIQWMHKGGHRVLLRLNVVPVEGVEATLVASFTDVTEQRRVENDLRRYEILFQRSTDMINVIDVDGQILYSSPSAEVTFGVMPTPQHPLGIFAMLHADEQERARAFHRRVIEGTSHEEVFVARTRTADGRWLFIESVAVNLLDHPVVRGIVITSRDVTERHVLAQELEHSATHDRLTGLANRALIDEQLAPALARAGRSGRRLALCYLDLDDFKRVNDELGHIAGDEVLVEVAARLRSALRQGDIAGRIGGDEFIALLDSVRDEDEARSTAERILATINGPANLLAGTVHLDVSIGVALNLPGDTADRLLQRSDQSLLEAKRRGKSRVWLSGTPDES